MRQPNSGSGRPRVCRCQSAMLIETMSPAGCLYVHAEAPSRSVAVCRDDTPRRPSGRSADAACQPTFGRVNAQLIIPQPRSRAVPASRRRAPTELAAEHARAAIAGQTRRAREPQLRADHGCAPITSLGTGTTHQPPGAPPETRAVSGLARPAESRALSAKGSLGTLCPRLPGLLMARISSGLAGKELHGTDTGGPGCGMA
jgi:hypothetical protein